MRELATKTRCGSFLMLSMLGVALMPRTAEAQLAPTGGHYGDRASDTGFDAGGPSSTGGYSASIPLNMPAPRGGLPLPVAVVSGARGYGAAGMGWDVPLYSVHVDNTVAHR